MWSQWPWVSSTRAHAERSHRSSSRSCSLAASSSTASPVSRAAQHEHVVVVRADHDLVDLARRRRQCSVWRSVCPVTARSSAIGGVAFARSGSLRRWRSRWRLGAALSTATVSRDHLEAEGEGDRDLVAVEGDVGRPGGGAGRRPRGAAASTVRSGWLAAELGGAVEARGASTGTTWNALPVVAERPAERARACRRSSATRSTQHQRLGAGRSAERTRPRSAAIASRTTARSGPLAGTGATQRRWCRAATRSLAAVHGRSSREDGRSRRASPAHGVDSASRRACGADGRRPARAGDEQAPGDEVVERGPPPTGLERAELGDRAAVDGDHDALAGRRPAGRRRRSLRSSRIPSRSIGRS